MHVTDMGDVNALNSTNNTLVGYKLLSFPNLSTLRRPQDKREAHTFSVHGRTTHEYLVIALARCLGVCCGANDILIGWRRATKGSSVAEQELVAARVCWEDTPTWSCLVQNIPTYNFGGDTAILFRALGLDEDVGQNPFLAVVSQESSHDHPLVASLDREMKTVTLHYSTLVFHPSAVEVFAEQIAAVIRHALEHQESNPKSLSFLPHSLLSVVEQRKETSYIHFPVGRTVSDYVARYATASQDSIALEYYPDLYEDSPVEKVQKLTYGELHKRSNQYAAYLIDRGLELEDRVALCMARGIEFHVCMLGILKAGGCYVPIDPELPEERRNFIAKDSAARFVFTDDDALGHLQNVQGYSDADVDVAKPEGLAYMLYTSGTTGVPKGCLLTHESFAHAIHALSWFSNQAGPNRRKWPQGGRYLAVASIAFDVHLAETFVPFALGMTLVAAPRAQLLEDLPRWVDTLRVTHIGIVPSLIEATMLAVSESAESAENKDPSERPMELAYIASGGEKMSDSILDRWADHPLITLANFYGPSEVTIGCSACLMSSSTRKENVGRIFDNCSAYVVDEDLNVLMRGGVGELLVGGKLVGRGYHNRPDLTEKAFIDWEGGKAYRTGDLVRLMPDDSIEIMGRIDTQIKLRGVRIESEGISAVIRNAAKAFPGLASESKAKGGLNPDVSTVLTRHPLLQTDQLVSFIAWDANVPIKHRRTAKPKLLAQTPRGLMKALRDACSRELASYMRPAHIVPMDFLPLNANGKTDNKVLVLIFQAETLESLSSAGSDKPEKVDVAIRKRLLSENEEWIADAVAKFTTVPRGELSPTSNLFELGLDSLKLVRLATTLRHAFSKGASQVTVAKLIEYPTIEGLDALLSSEQSADTEVTKESFTNAFEAEWRPKICEMMDADLVDSVLPTFPVQDGVLYRSADLETLYVQHVLLKLDEGVCIEKLKDSWKRLMKHNPILRTIFQFSTSIVQVILKPDACMLPWAERNIEIKQPEGFAEQFFSVIAEEIAKDINQNISCKPPFRLNLFSSPLSTKVLSIAIHHSLCDGISLEYLLRDVEAFYQGKELPPSIPPSQVLDEINKVDEEEALRFWKDTFDGFNWNKIPGRIASGEVAQTVSVEFREPLQFWEDMAAHSKVSVQALLTASFGVSLGRHLYGDSDVVFGVIRSGRSFADELLNESRYPLLTVNPLRVNASNDSSVILDVQRDIGRALPFEFFPLSRLQPALRPGKPLFEALFSLSIAEGSNSSIWQLLKSAQPQADYILAVEVVLEHKTGRVRVDSAFTEPLTRSFINKLLEDLETTALSWVEGKLTRSNSSSGLLSPTLVPSHLDSLDSEDGSDDDSALPVDEELETRIRSVVSRFLSIDKEKLAATTSLITLGLDSIKSVGLVRLLRQEGLKLTAIDLMRYPTIRRIAARQHSTEEKAAYNEERQAEAILNESLAEIRANLDPQSVKLSDEDVVEVYPTTELQSGMLSQTINSGGHLYVHEFPFTLSADLNLDRLRTALRNLIQSNSILRTSFHFLPDLGRWVQAVHSYFDLDWSESEIDGASPLSGQVEEWISTLGFSSEASFAKPPMYLRLFRNLGNSAEESRTLVLVLHHAVYDGISVTMLSNILDSYYHDEEPPATVQFVDMIGYFLYQERYGSQYWLNTLSSFNRTHSPRKEPMQKSSFQPSVQTEVILRITAKQTEQACMEFGATTQCFGQAALAKGLARIYENHDIVFGRVVSGRNAVEAEKVIGPLITTLPCRVTFSRATTNLDLVRMIHRGNTMSLKWQHSSLRSIQRKLSLPSLWDAIILFQPPPDNDNTNKLWRFIDAGDETAKIQYPLNIELHQKCEYMVVRAACQATFLDEPGLRTLLEDFALDMKDILDNPQAVALQHFPISDDNSQVFAGRPDDSVIEAKLPICKEFLPDIHSDTTFKQLLDTIATCTKVPLSIIKPDSSLASLGVDSISAIQIASKARRIGLTLHAAQILRCETISDLWSTLSSKARRFTVNEEVVASAVPPALKAALIQRVDVPSDLIDDVYPASPGIKWLVGMWQLSDRSRFQHAFAFKLRDDVDENKLKSAWKEVASASAILRSTFASTDSSNLHVVTFKGFPLDRLWSEKSLNDGEADVRKAMEELVSSPLSTTSPPARAVILRHNDSTYLILHLHHFQYDAWSLQLLVNDIEQTYLGIKGTIIHDYEAFMQFCVSKTTREQQRQYWTTYLPQPFTPSLLPKNYPDSVYEPLGRKEITVRTNLADVPNLRQRALQMSLSLNAVFLACWAQVQASFIGAGSATFGLWHLGRTGETTGLEKLAYPCMNVLPVHVRTSETSTREICNIVQAMLRQRTATIEQSYLEDLSKWAGDPGILCNVFVNIVVPYEDESTNDPVEGRILQPVHVPYYIPNIQHTEFEPSAERLGICDLIEDALMVDIIASRTEVVMSLEFSEAFLREADARRLIQAWVNAVQEALCIIPCN